MAAAVNDPAFRADAVREKIESVVMPGLVPGIHVSLVSCRKRDVDGQDKPGHDDREVRALHPR